MLDEIDKTRSEVRNALLTTLQEGTIRFRSFAYTADPPDEQEKRQIAEATSELTADERYLSFAQMGAPTRSTLSSDCTRRLFPATIHCSKVRDGYPLPGDGILIDRCSAKYNTFCETEVRAALKVKFDVSGLVWLFRWPEALSICCQAPMTSRISAVIAFMPFTGYEAQMGSGEIYYSIRRDLGPKSQVLLNAENDQEFVNMLRLVAEGYTLDAGYRSILAAADRMILPPVLIARTFPHTPLPPKPSGSVETLEEIKITTSKVNDTIALSARMV